MWGVCVTQCVPWERGFLSSVRLPAPSSLARGARQGEAATCEGLLGEVTIELSFEALLPCGWK